MTLANERGRWEVEVKKGSAAWLALVYFDHQTPKPPQP